MRFYEPEKWLKVYYLYRSVYSSNCLGRTKVVAPACLLGTLPGFTWHCHYRLLLNTTIHSIRDRCAGLGASCYSCTRINATYEIKHEIDETQEIGTRSVHLNRLLCLCGMTCTAFERRNMSRVMRRHDLGPNVSRRNPARNRL